MTDRQPWLPGLEGCEERPVRRRITTKVVTRAAAAPELPVFVPKDGADRILKAIYLRSLKILPRGHSFRKATTVHWSDPNRLRFVLRREIGSFDLTENAFEAALENLVTRGDLEKTKINGHWCYRPTHQSLPHDDQGANTA